MPNELCTCGDCVYAGADFLGNILSKIVKSVRAC